MCEIGKKYYIFLYHKVLLQNNLSVSHQVMQLDNESKTIVKSARHALLVNKS